MICTACGRQAFSTRYDRNAGKTLFDHGREGACIVVNQLAEFQARRAQAIADLDVGRAGD